VIHGVKTSALLLCTCRVDFMNLEPILRLLN
jgi:hypothetical protein